jgi:Icc protein
MHILHITDPHLHGNPQGRLRGVETASSLREVLDEALGQGPTYEAVLVTGDIVQDDPSGYARFRSILATTRTPVLCIPGNHDEPQAMRRALEDDPQFQMGGCFERAGWQIVLLDSCDPGHVGGRLATDELARLEQALARSSAHTMVCLHHHPIPMGSRWLDGIGLANAADFWRIIDAHSHVRAVVWGHVHQDFEGERAGVRLFATPSTGAQFLPLSDRYAVDSRPPAYRRFQLDPDGGLCSSVHWVDPLPLPRHAAAR